MSLTLDRHNIITDVIVVWRIPDRRVAEVWDMSTESDQVQQDSEHGRA